jgi:hypothetical protein
MDVCSPAIIYFIFSILQILIDILNKTSQDIYMKSLVIVSVTWLLNVLCQKDLTFVAWMFVFIPLVFMTISSIVFIQNCTSTNKWIQLEYIPIGSSSPAYQS